MSRVKGDLKLISKHASMVTTQVEQVLMAQNDLLNELNDKRNDNVVRVMTRCGRVTNLCILRASLRELSKVLREIMVMHLVLLRRRRKMIGLCMCF